MASIGKLLLGLGIGSFVLHLAGMEFKLLMWVDTWGESVGNVIRIACAVVGGILIFLGTRKKSAAAAADTLEDIQVKDTSKS